MFQLMQNQCKQDNNNHNYLCPKDKVELKLFSRPENSHFYVRYPWLLFHKSIAVTCEEVVCSGSIK